MARSDAFHRLIRTIRRSSGPEPEKRAKPSRRDVLKGAGSTLAAAAVPGSLLRGVLGAQSSPRIAIVGAGLAGLVCADRLRAKGFAATLYEANPSRLGGRCWSARGVFPGQVAELGGEFIDTGHKTMIGYAREFGLPREDVTREPGEIRYFFGGRAHSEAAVVDEYRELVERMRPDMQASTGAPTFFAHNQADIDLDNTDLESYLATRGAGLPLIQDVIKEAYVAEYGLEPHEQSCLNFLLFIHLDRRSKFTPFGVFSDERYHVVSGNDGIVSGLAARVPGPIETGMELQRIGRSAAGEFELKFRGVAGVRRADYVVLALPFTILRALDLEPSLGLSADKRRAIDELGYGNNAKTMIGFQGKPWFQNQGSNGSAYADLPNVQTTWETNPSAACPTSILTDYAGGERGRTLGGASLQTRVSQFLGDLEQVFPGASGQVSPGPGGALAIRHVWSDSPYVRGSYTCYRPGQFTTIAELESQAAGPLKFAGEHADSFYSWQGFMEGACLSGIRAANEVLADIRG